MSSPNCIKFYPWEEENLMQFGVVAMSSRSRSGLNG